MTDKPDEVNLSRYDERELEIIATIESDGHPLTQWWVDAYLTAARSVLGPNL
jgi:hypothetical protein